MSASLRPGDVLVTRAHVTLLDLDGSVYASTPEGVIGLDGVDPDGLRDVIGLVDGRTTVAQMTATLADRYDADDVVGLLEQLDGVLFERAAPPAPDPDPLATARIALLGAGGLAITIARELRRIGATAIDRIEITPSTTPDTLARALRGYASVVCAVEGVRGDHLLDVDAAARRAEVPVIFVTADEERCVVGPLVLPGRSPCFACSRLTTTLAGRDDDTAASLLPDLAVGTAATLPRWMIERAAFEVSRDAALLLRRGGPSPASLGRLLSLERAGEAREAPFAAATMCPACHGVHHGRRLDASAPAPPWIPERTDAVLDDTAGTRSVSLAEAEERARRALGVLGVELRCVPLPDEAPDALRALECPFFRVEPTVRFAPDAPVLFPHARGVAFGKGVTAAQARCSATYEWIERHLAGWRGQHDLVRASHAQVRDRAVDVPFLAAGLLPGLDLPGRRRFDPTAPIDWVWGRCLRTDRALLVPAAAVFLDATRFRGSAFELPSQGSSGLSAGCSLGDAVLQGLLEVVERDASSIALRSGRPCPRLDLDAVADPAIRALLHRIAAAGYDVLGRDITSIPGVATREVHLVRAEVDDYTHYVAGGHGAHLDPEVALRRAVTEAAQGMFHAASLGHADPLTSFSSFFGAHATRRQLLDRAGPATPPGPARPPSARGGAWAQIAEVTACVARAIPQADVCFVDLSHPALEGVHVVRAIITGTAHEVRPVQVHLPERARILPLEEMYLGPGPQ